MSAAAGLTATQRLADEARVWMHLAVELDAENRELRQWMTNMMFAAATRDALVALGVQEIERRWPSSRAGS